MSPDPVYEFAYFPICRKPYRGVQAPFGITAWVPDCYHPIIATSGTTSTTSTAPQEPAE